MTRLAIDGRRIQVRERVRAGRIVYRCAIPVPEHDGDVPVRIELLTATRPWRPQVYAQAPECLRHRFRDGSLCMWWELDPRARRWMPTDGLSELIHHIRRHLFQEACCRAGLSWPGEQSPGDHPRPRRCSTCGGQGE
jgi:hypothetical protein